jgi:hypothetical protein
MTADNASSTPTNLEALEMALAPIPGGFCERHFSWLCGVAQGQCQRDYWAALNDRGASDG